jgi:hypothetical protein
MNVTHTHTHTYIKIINVIREFNTPFNKEFHRELSESYWDSTGKFHPKKEKKKA